MLHVREDAEGDSDEAKEKVDIRCCDQFREAGSLLTDHICRVGKRPHHIRVLRKTNPVKDIPGGLGIT